VLSDGSGCGLPAAYGQTPSPSQLPWSGGLQQQDAVLYLSREPGEFLQCKSCSDILLWPPASHSVLPL